MLKFFVSVHVLWTSAGFVLGFDSTSSHFWMKNYKNSLETRFTECAGSRVFGIHTVVYVRRIYDEKRKSFVTQEVKHHTQYTYYLICLTFTKWTTQQRQKGENHTNSTKNEFGFELSWFDNSLTCFLLARIVLELIAVLFLTVLCIRHVCKCGEVYTCIMLQPIRRWILGQALTDVAGGCPTLTQRFSYFSYIFCGNTDRDSVYEHLVVPPRKEKITTGFIFEEC